MYLDVNLVNSIFVISLILLAVCSVIFLIFFIPVLIQLSKTLEAIQTIATLLKQYSLHINDRITDAGEGLNKVKQVAFGLFGSVADLVLKVLKK